MLNHSHCHPKHLRITPATYLAYDHCRRTHFCHYVVVITNLGTHMSHVVLTIPSHETTILSKHHEHQFIHHYNPFLVR